MNKGSYPDLPILLVDDEKSWLKAFSFALEYNGGINNILTCSDSREVMAILDRQKISIVILDLTMPHLSGQELLAMIVDNHPDIPVVVVSGLNQVDTAVQCIKQGASEYFIKTEETERLVNGIRKTLTLKNLQEENALLRDRVLEAKGYDQSFFDEIVTTNRGLQSIFHYLAAISRSSEPILVTGESGVGKELIARAIHALGGADRPMVSVNVAGLDDAVFSDTLFGHTRGAFSGAESPRAGLIEEAEGGTLFLDEIGDLNLASQVKLLRLLQEGEFFPLGADLPKHAKVRIVVATNQDLGKRQQEGDFRKDLFYRLSSHHVHIPPLRDRLEDIPLLLDHFLAEAAESMRKRKPDIPEELILLLMNYHFPGNVRELRAMIFDALGVHGGGTLSMSTFRNRVGLENEQLRRRNAPEETICFDPSRPLPTIVEATEVLVDEALKRSRGNQSIASGMLGISRQALNKRLQKNRNQNY